MRDDEINDLAEAISKATITGIQAAIRAAANDLWDIAENEGIKAADNVLLAALENNKRQKRVARWPMRWQIKKPN